MSEACRSCKAPIIWCITKGGNHQPVDAVPSMNGNLVLEPRGSVMFARVADLFDRPGDRYVPHHATCPQADEWRKPKKGAQPNMGDK